MSKSCNGLIKKYPMLFERAALPMNQTCMCWGIECGDGWYDLLDDLCKKLTDLIMQLDEDDRKNFEADQVKEKFGGLRFYMTCSTDEMEELIVEAEHLSERTCERCGAPGEIRGEGWIMCRCDACHNQWVEAHKK